jgi:hypothetical protein
MWGCGKPHEPKSTGPKELFKTLALEILQAEVLRLAPATGPSCWIG